MWVWPGGRVGEAWWVCGWGLVGVWVGPGGCVGGIKDGIEGVR